MPVRQQVTTANRFIDFFFFNLQNQLRNTLQGVSERSSVHHSTGHVLEAQVCNNASTAVLGLVLLLSYNHGIGKTGSVHSTLQKRVFRVFLKVLFCEGLEANKDEISLKKPSI